jgi:adenylate cyclase
VGTFVDRLTKREFTIAGRYASGETYRHIADSLCIAPATVRSHIASIYQKLEINSKPALVTVLSQYRAEQNNEKIVSSERPSIAVLPFTNLSTDPDNDFFVAGITEEILARLSRFREIVVVSRKSSVLASEQSMDASEAARVLGVQFALGGSIRKSGERVRIIATLYASQGNQQIWSESYEHFLHDIFRVQDDVALRIVGMLVGKIEQSNQIQTAKKGTDELTAYECVLRGRHYFGDWRGTKGQVLKARQMFERAIEIDPYYAAAYSGLSATYCEEFEHSWTNDPDAAGERCIELALKAIELDEHDSLAHLSLSSAYWHIRKDFDLAFSQLHTAIELNPNYYWNYCYGCFLTACTGDLTDCVAYGTEAIRRNPLLPGSCLSIMGLAEYLQENYEKAIETISQIDKPLANDYACLTASYAQLSRLEEAKSAGDEFFRLGKYEAMTRDDWYSFWLAEIDFKDEKPVAHLIEGMEKAGFVSR